MNEFNLIERYFKSLKLGGGPVELGIGDDCALIPVPEPGHRLAISTDTLVAGRHFLSDANAFDIGYKALAVNLSDLAAMGATPAWFSLCLTLPEANSQWLEAFCAGLAAVAAEAPIQLIGGDTTQGPLTISIQVIGTLAPGLGLRRAGALENDDIYVSGILGAGGLGLRLARDQNNGQTAAERASLQRYLRPSPRVNLGQRLLRLAHSCIDVSDGLLGDLGHILTASDKGACIDARKIPLAQGLSNAESTDVQFALNAGDDYELCFTAPAAKATIIQTLATQLSLPLTRIGIVTTEPGLQVQGFEDETIVSQSYQHF